MNEPSSVLITAYIADMIAGDPRWFPHPVKIIGLMIIKLERILRKTTENQRIAGVFLWLAVIGVSGYASYMLIRTAKTIHPVAYTALSAILIYSSISVKDLKDKASAVYYSLKNRDLLSARTNLSMIVGRDTQNLSEKEIVKASIETIAESTTDGIIAPIFYAVIGGPVLAVIYKAVNTLDSMVGYKNEKYKDFGWFSAKLDDIANFIPARICGLLIFLASFILAKDFRNSFKIMLRDGRKHASPNSGISEAAMAGALGIRLGGNSFYNSILSVKPYLGEEIRKIGINNIKEALTISSTTAFLMIITSAAICLAL